MGTCLGRKSMDPEGLISAIERRKRRRKEDVEERLLTQLGRYPRGVGTPEEENTIDISIAKDERLVYLINIAMIFSTGGI